MSATVPVSQTDNFKTAMCLLDDLAMDIDVPDQTYIMLANALKDGREAIIEPKLPQVANPIFRDIVVNKRRGEICGMIVVTTYHGIMITRLNSPESIAAGFKPGDLIHTIGGIKITSAERAAAELRRRYGAFAVTIQRTVYEVLTEENAHIGRHVQHQRIQNGPPQRQRPVQWTRGVFNRIVRALT